jgi:hypothetical protein
MTPTIQGMQAGIRAKDPQIRAVSEQLEAQFLSIMLDAAGLGAPREAFGGGEGESQFSSFLTAEYADATVRAGGVGLSEAIYNALVTAKEDQ